MRRFIAVCRYKILTTGTGVTKYENSTSDLILRKNTSYRATNNSLAFHLRFIEVEAGRRSAGMNGLLSRRRLFLEQIT
jgi:hypothetical protein